MRYTVVDRQGAVVNIIEWDGESPYDPGEGASVRPHDPEDRVPVEQPPLNASRLLDVLIEKGVITREDVPDLRAESALISEAEAKA